MPQNQAPQRPYTDRIAAVRHFNRFYTRQIGALDEGHLHSPFSLGEVRALYEIAHRDTTTTTELGRDLRLDTGYLSRLLQGLERRGIVKRTPSPTDGRQSLLTLTPDGRSTFQDLDARAGNNIATLIAPLSEASQHRLVEAMRTVEQLLTQASEPSVPYLLRPHQPGDMGYIVYRQATLYAQEYGWNAEYESLIARIVADFLDRFDAARERCWIAEREQTIVGSVFLIRHPEHAGVAQLRLLYVEPSVRRLGIGRRLVQECTRFAHRAGYHTIVLWTNSVLTSARKIYEAEGYTLVKEESHHSFGRDLIGQTWELVLAGKPTPAK